MSTVQPALGKGLASLLPNARNLQNESAQPQSSKVIAASANMGQSRIPGVTLLSVSEITPNPYQPRRDFDEATLKELSESIKENGLIQPIIVRKGSYGYQLIAGERRFRASQMAGLKMIPVVVRQTTDKEALELAIIENVQREDLNCVDEALAYQQLIEEFKLSQEDVAKKVAKDRSTIANFLRILKLPKQIIESLKKNSLSLGHAKVLMSLDTAEEKISVFNKVMSEHLSVRATERLCHQMKLNPSSVNTSTSGSVKNNSPTTVESHLKKLSEQLMKWLGSKVEIMGDGKKGKLVLNYHSSAELEKLIQKLSQ
jgi:ParB family chromosome partitioning protein